LRRRAKADLLQRRVFAHFRVLSLLQNFYQRNI